MKDILYLKKSKIAGKSTIFALMKRIIIIFIMCVPLIAEAQNAMSVLNHLHQVSKGETLYKIAQQYNVTEQDLLSANPDIAKKKKLKKGTYLAIPQASTVSQGAAVKNKVSGRLTKSSLRIGIILPFVEKSERAKDMIEFYQGFLMAADNAKKENLSMDIYAYGSGSTEADIIEVLGKPDIARLDILFGPVDEQQLPATINFCKTHNIKLVLPFVNQQSTEGNAHLYIACPGNTVITTEAAKLVTKAYTDRNFIILKTNNENSKGTLFTQTLSDMLVRKGSSVHIVNSNSDDNTFVAAMSQTKTNVIVPDNSSIRTLNNVITKLISFRQRYPGYNLSLLGYPEWQTHANKILDRFFELETYIYSPYYYNAIAARTKLFEQTFSRNFRKPMAVNYPRYAMMGYDLAWYFLHDIAFQGAAIGAQQEPYQNMFRFIQEADNGGYTNRFIQLIHYTKSRQIELIR